MSRSLKVSNYIASIISKEPNLKLVDEFGDEVMFIQKYKDKLILAVEKPIGVCNECGGPVFNDNKTSFKYHCPNEGVNLYKVSITFNKR